LFVPYGSPHFVENLTNTIAISANYIDSTNILAAIEALSVQSLIDPLAKPVLEQLRPYAADGNCGLASAVDVKWCQLHKASTQAASSKHKDQLGVKPPSKKMHNMSQQWKKWGSVKY
jgi:hypothetical protein